MTPINAVPVLRRVYWETTAACNLRCIHCRRVDVLNRMSPEEMSTVESEEMIDDLASMGKPVLILSGGEPLLRKDIFDIAAYASSRGLPVALSTNGTLLTDQMVQKIKRAGIYYVSISLDGAVALTHDTFRGEGNFTKSLEGARRLKAQGLKVQINFTVTKQNADEIPAMIELAQDLSVNALYLFLLVPVGCGVEIADSHMLSAQATEKWLKWVYLKSKETPFELRPICAPQYYRIAQEMGASVSATGEAKRLGCIAGTNICFISHKGDVFPCGYLPSSSGNIKEKKLSKIWASSKQFKQLRDFDLLEGKCGACSHKVVCGGCRARGFHKEGSILAEETHCFHEPVTH